MAVDIRNVITCFKFGDDRFRGLALAEGQILPFPIDFDGRPYNTLTLPCERVMIKYFWNYVTTYTLCGCNDAVKRLGPASDVLPNMLKPKGSPKNPDISPINCAT